MVKAGGALLRKILSCHLLLLLLTHSLFLLRILNKLVLNMLRWHLMPLSWRTYSSCKLLLIVICRTCVRVTIQLLLKVCVANSHLSRNLQFILGVLLWLDNLLLRPLNDWPCLLVLLFKLLNSWWICLLNGNLSLGVVLILSWL